MLHQEATAPMIVGSLVDIISPERKFNYPGGALNEDMAITLRIVEENLATFWNIFRKSDSEA